MTIAKIADLGNSRYFEPSDKALKTSKLTKYPGNSCFMPPEALEDPVSYDFKLDCFSFGILILAVWNHQYPPNFTRKSKSLLRPDTPMREIEIRKPFFDCLEEYPDLNNLTKKCLADDKKDRPSSREILSNLNFKVLI